MILAQRLPSCLPTFHLPPPPLPSLEASLHRDCGCLWLALSAQYFATPRLLLLSFIFWEKATVSKKGTYPLPISPIYSLRFPLGVKVRTQSGQSTLGDPQSLWLVHRGARDPIGANDVLRNSCDRLRGSINTLGLKAIVDWFFVTFNLKDPEWWNNKHSK